MAARGHDAYPADAGLARQGACGEYVERIPLMRRRPIVRPRGGLDPAMAESTHLSARTCADSATYPLRSGCTTRTVARATLGNREGMIPGVVSCHGHLHLR